MISNLASIPEAIEDIKKGKLVIVVDNEDRENEGDFITAARNATPDLINFLATQGRGLICVPLTKDRAFSLGLPLMVQDNTALYQTPFTISVDLLGHGCTTGISAFDRAKTVQALIDSETKPADLGRPGHIFPLQAAHGGVLERPGHTEAAVDLARLSGYEEAGVLVEIMNPDGTMARLPELIELAKKFNCKIISIKELITYRKQHDPVNVNPQKTVLKEADATLPTKYGNFDISIYRDDKGIEHLVLSKNVQQDKPILVRIHSSCMTGDIFGSLRCDCGPQFQQAMELLGKSESGILIYLNQEGRGIGLLNKIKAYKLQDKGFDTVEANEELGFPADTRDYRSAADILQELHISKIRLITNNPDKEKQLKKYGITVIDIIPLEVLPNAYNKKYLETKKQKLHHKLNLV
ncbi:MAG TPA: GTP cyclohydrolase II [Candidatus Acidoferrales bacterium]|nr:GTP cyclohydrolase II [Candidatus Acidoferrales bacterium]